MNKFKNVERVHAITTTGSVLVLRVYLLARGVGREDALNLIGWLAALIDASDEGDRGGEVKPSRSA